jgi:hypothetical protein
VNNCSRGPKPASAGCCATAAVFTLRYMDPRSIIISRIDLQLRRHLGHTVDTHRAVNDTRYAKDILLVCDAMEGTDLPQLATQFRVADEQMSAARRALAPRVAPRMPTAHAPVQAAAAQRPVTFGRDR